MPEVGKLLWADFVHKKIDNKVMTDIEKLQFVHS